MIQLQIRTQPLQYQLNIQKPVFELEITHPTIEQTIERPVLEIEQPKGTLEIDQSAMRASLGSQDWTSWARENAQRGKTTAMEGIARIAQDGDRLMRIENGGNPIPDMAEEAIVSETGELTLAPMEAPVISYQANRPNIQVAMGKADVVLHRGEVHGQYQAGKVDMQITQYPSIQFWTTGSLVDTTV